MTQERKQRSIERTISPPMIQINNPAKRDQHPKDVPRYHRSLLNLSPAHRSLLENYPHTPAPPPQNLPPTSSKQSSVPPCPSPSSPEPPATLTCSQRERASSFPPHPLPLPLPPILHSPSNPHPRCPHDLHVRASTPPRPRLLPLRAFPCGKDSRHRRRATLTGATIDSLETETGTTNGQFFDHGRPWRTTTTTTTVRALDRFRLRGEGDGRGVRRESHAWDGRVKMCKRDRWARR